MGLFATQSGATRDLFDAAESMLRRIKGGVGAATVIANAIFAAITGVSVASAAVFSKLAIPEMNRLGYDRKFGLGIVASSALLGMLIPPSILMIVYGVITEESIGRLFAAGIGPGLVVAGVLIATILVWVRIDPGIVGREGEVAIDVTVSRLDLLVKVLPIFALIALVLGGI
jgi:tripartite ATP-independent transporter DctM subunit